jgi:hypothetical protein
MVRSDTPNFAAVLGNLAEDSFGASRPPIV